MIVHFKAIEDTFLMMEQCYGLKLTDGLESFLVSVFNRIIEDQRLWEINRDNPCEDIPFREEIFTDACKEMFSVYREGALEKECQKREIAFLEETKENFHKIRARLDREAQDGTEDVERQINEEYRMGMTPYRIDAEYRMGMTPYQGDAPREELIRRGKWRFLQMAMREWNDDTEGHFYVVDRMFKWNTVNLANAYYTVEAVGAEGNPVDLETWRYVGAEVYDAFLREIFESYGSVEFSGGKYVLRIKSSLACGAMAEEIKERETDLLPNRLNMDVRVVYCHMMAMGLGKVGGLLYRLKCVEDEAEELVVTGSYRLHEEKLPDLNSKPHDMTSEEQTITYEEYKNLITRIEEKYPLTLQRGDEEEHMKLLEEKRRMDPMGKSFMETVWCLAILRTPNEYRNIYGPLERRIIYDVAQMVCYYYDKGKLEAYCKENDLSLQEIFRQELGIPEERLLTLRVNHEELVRDGKKEMLDQIKTFLHGWTMDREDEFYLVNFILMTSLQIEELITTEKIDYYVMEPIVYGKDRWYNPDFHRLYIPKFTYDGLMRTAFEEIVGYRISGDRYHLTISQEEMEIIMEKRISREIHYAKSICSHPECEGEMYAWYKLVWQLWEAFVNYVKTVYQAYGAGRPEMALYGPFYLPQEKLPLRYKQFLMDCWKQ